MTKAGRIRTESMIDRLGRKPLSEGFELWDKDYMLGALRLFQCKLEVAPPFEVAACLDAVGDILAGIEEPEEALEHYNQAVDKYTMINKTILADLMRCKAVELQEGKGCEAALEAVDKCLASFDARLAEGKTGEDLLCEAKGQGPALGRLYLYRAELLKCLEKFDESLAAANTAIDLKCDRIHLAYGTLGDIQMDLDNVDEAIEAYKKAVEAKPSFVAAHESWIKALRSLGDDDTALSIIDNVLKLHPKAVLIRDKAFVLSNKKQDEQALALLDEAIANPPHEETETLSAAGSGPSVLTLRKAKSAILADLSRFEEANEELSMILKVDPEEEEATAMRKDIYITLAREYLGKHDIPHYLDSLIAKVLETKPDAPISFMIECIEKEIEKERCG
eukprot:TRINITY_DN3791_c2_g1_i1.p1 TRINITY_DN3791_c2_g1~~TRINITY_DN3791_c2_g1_i1.p1  ORF type:complete len:416 (+),score=113.87 TRINITY_DN3791_c2_g1_i1:73-1248(+)